MAEVMDIDMDIDLTVDADTAQLEAEAMQTSPPSGPRSPGDPQPAPQKVHIRGLDQLTTDDITQYAAEHYLSDQFHRVEWIDDTSANLIYRTKEAAAEALKRLSDSSEYMPEVTPVLQLRRARPSSQHPTSELQVRQALSTDVKAKRACEASRFYLMNPEYDPEERRKDNNRRGRGGRRQGGEDGYRRNRYDDREHQRRKDREGGAQFEVSMYDDDPASLAVRRTESRRNSYGSFSSNDRDKRRVRLDGELFRSKSNGRLRDRSASPQRDGDGRFGFRDDQPARRPARQRSLTPPAQRHQKNYGARDNIRKELFPDKLNNNPGVNSVQFASDPPVTKELFPDRPSLPKRTRELFPNKTERSNHRRSDALDANETADLFAHRMTLSYTADNLDNSTHNNSGDFASRLGGNKSSFGRLLERPSIKMDQEGFNIKGSASAQDTSGFSIRGASKVQDVNPVVKELFPMKAGNSGKELFADKIQGRGGQRRRAEDLF
ncbi:hypothetical protein LTR66_013058 [Elasticomyces elasticus]|nr:hypothetical protein LTR66_013058 [Elasticomyces elasticus]